MVERGATYRRVKLDDYSTPAYSVLAVVAHLERLERDTRGLSECERIRPLGEYVFDPCAGRGRLVKALLSIGRVVQGRDLRRDRYDFLGDDPYIQPGEYDILTNPPYGGGGRTALRFIEQAVHMVRPWLGQVVMLLPADFDSGVTRTHVFEHQAFAHKVVLTRRIKWFDNQSGSTNHAWYVWDWRHAGPATMSWMEGVPRPSSRHSLGRATTPRAGLEDPQPITGGS